MKLTLGLLLTGGFCFAFVIVSCRKAPEEKKFQLQEPPLTLELRGDAVEPPREIDIEYEIDGTVSRVQNVQPGRLFELGPIKEGVLVRFKVYNVNGAGFVRAIILTNLCGRKIAKCNTPNCIAEAEYRVRKEECRHHHPSRG